jgi:hypothetical protein
MRQRRFMLKKSDKGNQVSRSRGKAKPLTRASAKAGLLAFSQGQTAEIAHRTALLAEPDDLIYCF